MEDIAIRDLSSLDEYQQTDEVQRRAWERDLRSLVPWEFMKAAQYNGGALIGAFHGRELVGYVFGILGSVPALDSRIDPVAAARLQMYSHQLAVLPEYQGRQIGRRLKLKQREFCQRIGVRLITWTFPPLMARNAWLNIGRLGGIAATFLPNWYGAGRHRLYLEWWITSNRISSRIERERRPLSLAAMLGGGATIANPTTINDAGLPVPPDTFETIEGATVLLEIPADMDRILQTDPALAQTWRDHSRALFERFLQAGFVITDIARDSDETGRARTFYLATHRDAGSVFERLS